jgi:hypothetical protein
MGRALALDVNRPDRDRLSVRLAKYLAFPKQTESNPMNSSVSG